MGTKSLTDRSIALMSLLMLNETVAEKVKSAGGEGKSYAIFRVCDNGTVVLGETRFEFWNRLIGCQKELTFESWALAVWDALVSLSTGNNAVAIEEGLSVEIAKKAQREENYNWVVERLNDVFDHVCNNKDGGASLEGDRRKSGSSVIVNHKTDPVIVNVHVSDEHRVFRFPDATGKAFLNLETGIVGMSISKSDN